MSEETGSADRAALERILDRVAMSDEEQLGRLMQGELLPRLLVMTNDRRLREESVLLRLIQLVLRRLKETPSLRVNCSGVVALVDPQHLPFACTFAAVMLEVALKMDQEHRRGNLSALVLALSRFAPLSPQASLVLHLLLPFLEELPGATDIPPPPASVDAFADWVIDVLLVQRSISKGEPGSLLPGLSQPRVDRLLAKRDRLTLTDAKPWKLGILRMGFEWIPFRFELVSLLIAMSDADPEVAREACRRQHHLATTFNQLEHSKREEALTLLSELILGGNSRSALREELASVAMEFVHRSLSLDWSSAGVMVNLLRKVLTSQRGMRLRAVCLSIIDGMLGSATEFDSSDLAAELKAIIGSYISVFVTGNAFHLEGYSQSARKSCYRILAALLRRSPDRFGDLEMVTMLLKATDREDTDAAMDLLVLLEEMRRGFIDHPVGVDSSLILSLLKRCTASTSAKKRLLGLQWSRTIFGFDACTVELILALSDDPDEDTSKASAAIFSNYIEYIGEQETMPLLTQFSGVLLSSTNKMINYDGGIVRAKGLNSALYALSVLLTKLLLRTYQDGDSNVFSGASFPFVVLSKDISCFSESNTASQIIDALLIISIQKSHAYKSSSDCGEIIRHYINCWYLLVVAMNNDLKTCTVDKAFDHLAQVIAFTDTYDPISLRRLAFCMGLLFLSNRVTHVSEIMQLFDEDSIHGFFCRSCILECMIAIPDDDPRIVEVRDCSEKHIIHAKDILLNISSDDDWLSVNSLQHLASNGLFTLYLAPEFNIMSSGQSFSIGNGKYFSADGDFKQLTDMLSSLFKSIKNANDRLAAELVELVSRIVEAGVPLFLIDRTWEEFLSNQIFTRKLPVFKFKISEGLLRIARLQNCKVILFSQAEREAHPLFRLKVLLEFIEKNIFGESIQLRNSVCTLLLVFLNSLDGIYPDLVLDGLLLRCVKWFLCSLKENDLYLQDISCLGLISCNNLARHSALRVQISNEIIAVLTKEKKPAQPVGYAVAGQDTPTTMNDGISPNIMTDDPMARAEEALAAQLGIILETPVVHSITSAEIDVDKFGVYSTISKIVRKTGDSDSLFALLGMMRRDPQFSAGEAAAFYEKYLPPQKHLNVRQLERLVPNLYIHQFDPRAEARDILQKLWMVLIPSGSAKTLIDSVENDILLSLTSSLTSNSWRVREAACFALESFIASRSFETLFQHIDSLWSNGIKVLNISADRSPTYFLNCCRLSMTSGILLVRLH